MDPSPLRVLSVTVQLAILAGGAALFAVALVHSADEIPQHFTDIAGRSQFSYKTNNDFRNRKYLAATMCGGVAAFDFDGDGWVDLYFTNGARIPEMRKTGPEFNHCLLRNRHDGAFEDVTRKAGLEGKNLGYAFGVAAGDYDNDGHTDLFVATAGRDALFHNNGDGTFTDVTAGSGLDTKPPDTMSVAAVWFDYDNDGLLDLAVSEYTLWRPETEFHCTGPGDLGEAYCHPKRYKSVPNRLYHNLGGGKFEDVTERSGFAKSLGKGMGIVVADFNRDGLMDVFVSNDTERNFLYLNKGDGQFEEVGLLWGVAYNEDGAMISGMGADAKDYDNDGWPDIFYNDLNSQVFGLFQNDRGRSFRDLSVQSGVARLSRRFSGWSNGFIDYDNDGWKDIYSSNGDVDYIGSNSKQHDTMWRNIGGRSFEDVSEKLGPDFLPLGYHKGSAFADLNNDGFMDLIVTALNERPRILINSGNSNHWLLLALQGTKSNRDAIGAQVKVTTGFGRTLYNHVTTSVGFMSSSDRRVHFGLGAETKIASIEIRWPSGKLQKLGETAIDQILRVQEPR
jgi:enediyne biosynthesis protein E4